MSDNEQEEKDADNAQEIAADVVLALCDALGEWRSKTDLGPYGCGEYSMTRLNERLRDLKSL